MLKRFSLLVLLIILLWVSFFPFPVQRESYKYVNILLLATFLYLLIRGKGKLFKKEDIYLWIFVAALAINVLFAQYREIAFKTFLNLTIPLFTLHYLIKDSISYRNNFRFIFITAAICFFGGMVALIGILEALFHFNPIYEYFVFNEYYRRYIDSLVIRPMSTQFNPAVLGSYLLFCLPFYLLWVNNGSRLIRWSARAGIILNVTICLLTFSRGTLLGLSAMVIFYLAIAKKYRLIIISLLILMALVTACSYLPYPFSKFSWENTLGSGGALANYRIERFIMTGRIIKDHPLAGLGFEHFRIRFSEYYPGKEKVVYEKMIADNMYLTILAETSIIGFCGFCIFAFGLLKRGFYRLKPALVYQDRQALLAVIASFIGLLVTMAGYELFYWPSPFFLFCILSGMMAGLNFDKS